MNVFDVRDHYEEIEAEIYEDDKTFTSKKGEVLNINENREQFNNEVKDYVRTMAKLAINHGVADAQYIRITPTNAMYHQSPPKKMNS